MCPIFWELLLFKIDTEVLKSMFKSIYRQALALKSDKKKQKI
jgi:hypothetical protein